MGTPTFIHGNADLVYRQPEPVLDHIQQTGFSHAAGSRKRADFPLQLRFQFIQPHARFCGGVNHAVADRFIKAKKFLCIFNEINFICDDHSRDLLFFSDDQETVQHSKFWIWIRASEDEYGLIGICQQNLLIYSLRARIQPDDGLFALFDIFHDPAAVIQKRDLYMVAECGNITHGSPLFELAAQPTNDKALTGFHCKETRLGFDDQTAFLNFVCQIFTFVNLSAKTSHH